MTVVGISYKVSREVHEKAKIQKPKVIDLLHIDNDILPLLKGHG